jgi:hypothetical protein
MKEAIGSVELLNRTTGEFEPAGVYRNIDESNLSDFEQEWQPLLHERRDALQSAAEIEAANVQDAHWDWRAKADVRAQSLAHESFAIEANGMTQGLLFAKTAAFGRLREQQGLDLVYVEYIATAPWNRAGFTPTPLYKGVGRILLATAISLSVDLGFHGRLALHSIPQSESWYRVQCGMTDLGPDLEADQRGVLRYFEMTPAQAESFIST